MLLPGFDVDKAAQATAFFALKAGGAINVLKLSKLLYLAEREFIKRYDMPMFFDHLVSMPDGPVVSVTLNLINGNLEDARWSRFVSPRSGYDIEVSDRDINLSSFIDLSAADLDVLNDLWERFRSYDKYRLRDWTHNKQNIPEWENPEGSAYLISHKNLFELLGKSDPNSMVEDLETYRDMKKSLDKA